MPRATADWARRACWGWQPDVVSDEGAVAVLNVNTKIGTVPVSLPSFTEISVTEDYHPYVGAWWPPGHNIGWEHMQIIEKFHFLDAVANDKPMNPCNATFEDGYHTAVIIDAMRQSSRTGQRIPIQF
jgi:predicted dehydrogenase